VKHWNKLCQAFEQLLRRGTNYSTIALGSALGRLLHVLTASSDHEIETAFAAAVERKVGAPPLVGRNVTVIVLSYIICRGAGLILALSFLDALRRMEHVARGLLWKRLDLTAQ
jgi:hypothetical protein